MQYLSLNNGYTYTYAIGTDLCAALYKTVPLCCSTGCVSDIWCRHQRSAAPTPCEMTFHRHLAKFFYNQPHSSRRTEELPWHLERSGELNKLCSFLSDTKYVSLIHDESVVVVIIRMWLNFAQRCTALYILFYPCVLMMRI